ncbi:MAG: GatB/YqeY domain-containing protein [Chloroflexi bacterium]|nr:GatB/YqeY domain-containing protein [Chloroflexota bacterium]
MLKQRLQDDLKVALRAGDRQRVEVIRMALAALQQVVQAERKARYDAAVAAGGAAAVGEIELSDAMVQDTLTREVKRRRESAELFRAGGRVDLATQEEAEIVVLEAYLPRQLTADELRPLVAAVIAELGAAGPGDTGRVMPRLMQQFKGQAEGRLINQVARELLNRQ